MSYYDESLKELQQQVGRKKKLESILWELEEQKIELEEKVSRLEKTKLKEESDVEKLQGKSLTAIFYTILGNKEERLDKEKQEACAAVLKYKTALQELESIKSEIQQKREELRRLTNCEERYKQKLNEKKESIKNSNSSSAREILKVEEKISYLENQVKEIQEAIEQGVSAENVANKVLEHLEEAEGLATWDMWGGRMAVDMMKHEELDQAQLMVGHLQQKLRRFKSELAEVKITADYIVSSDDFTRFADYFFDGLVMDATIRNEIKESKSQVENTRWQIQHTVENLEDLKKKVRLEQDRMKDRLEDLVLSSSGDNI